jgi:hypothetical protein
MFDKDLLVIEKYDAEKSIDDYEFKKIPIWVRVFNLPLGRMTRKTGEDIGDRIGEFLEVDGMEKGLAVRRYLRVKVRMMITEPIMRGTMVEVDEKGTMRWCPFEFEYLPDFCFICGIIGHVDKECTKSLGRGEEAQYGKWFKWLPPRRMPFGDTRKVSNEGGGRRQNGWASGGSKSGSGRGLGSDAPF